MAIVSCEHWMDWNPRIYINAEVVGGKRERKTSVVGSDWIEGDGDVQ